MSYLAPLSQALWLEAGNPAAAPQSPGFILPFHLKITKHGVYFIVTLWM
jgi:hypothetical protein